MFYEPGWVPLRLITNQIYDLIGEQLDKDRSEWEADGEDRRVFIHQGWTCDLTFLLLSKCKCSCLTPSGRVHIAREIVEPISDTDWENDHIDLRLGTIGSGHWTASHSDQPRTRYRDKLEQYGPFLYAPVIVKKDDYELFLRVRGEQMPTQGTLRASQIEKELVELFDAGQFDSRPKAWELIGKRCKTESQFRIGWTAAAKQRPDMAKPGRRPFNIPQPTNQRS